MNDPLVIDIREAGKRLSVSRSAIYRLIESGQLRPVKIGRSIRFRPDDVRDLVDRLAESVR